MTFPGAEGCALVVLLVNASSRFLGLFLVLALMYGLALVVALGVFDVPMSEQDDDPKGRSLEVAADRVKNEARGQGRGW